MCLNRFLKMTNKSKFNNIAIIGLGLIGSSVALAIKKIELLYLPLATLKALKLDKLRKKLN